MSDPVMSELLQLRAENERLRSMLADAAVAIEAAGRLLADYRHGKPRVGDPRKVG